MTKTNHWTKTMNGTRTVEVVLAMMTFVEVELAVQVVVHTYLDMIKITFAGVIQPIFMQELAVVII